MARKKVGRRNVSPQFVIDYSETLLRQIRGRFNRVGSFTREDLLHLPISEFEQVATITRYRATCLAVSYLVENGKLVQKKFPDLCLPEQAAKYRFDESSISTEYAPTIQRLVRSIGVHKRFTVMQVVTRWRTDPQLTQDSKRKAVRNALRRLTREGVCDKVNSFEFAVGDMS